MSEEIPLAGGRLAGARRVGDTVRRPSGPWTPAVHALLDHLRSRGFDAAPRPRGLDEQGREILEYVPGETIGDALPWPDWARSDETLVGAARLLRDYHEAVAGFAQPAGSRWRLSDRRPGPGEIVCHNDCAPYNLVRAPGGKLHLIDFDVAGPGTALEDVAFGAWNFVPLFDDPYVASLGFEATLDRAARLRLWADAYGLHPRDGFVERIRARIERSVGRITAAAEAGEPAFRALVEGGRLDVVRAAARWVDREADALQSVLDA